MTVIWLSVKYQNAVNVPLISSHIKVLRSSLYPNLSTRQFYFPCRPFFPNCFFHLKLNQFLKEIVLIMRNCYITMSEIELVFRRAELRCSGPLYSMLLFKKMYLIQIFNQYLLNKKDDTCRPMDTNLSVLIESSL